jgi:anti-sigma factor RsiW
MEEHRAVKHPERPALEAFALGRLEAAEIPRVERHLEGCAACARLVQATPDDHLIRLLRRTRPAPAPDATDRLGGPPPGNRRPRGGRDS